MALLEILKDQSAFGFTGKINALLKSNGQFFGVVYQSEGYIVDAKVQNISGKKGLLNLIFIDVEKDDYLKFVVEPEVLNHENFTMKLSFEELKKDAEKKFAHYLSSKKLKPPGNLKLLIDPEIIVNNDQITPEEFDVLALLSEWCLVSDIYKYSKLMDYEVTDALVTLRKKKAIKVFQN
jgi:hypothetical protein